MARFLFIGDIHGRDDWKDLAEKAIAKGIHVIFLGDYVDSFNIRPILIKINLLEIIKFKKLHLDKVTLLLGNHDYAYIDCHHGTSGFKWQMWQDYKQIYQENYDLFQVAWGYTNPDTQKYTLASHAGLTLTYYNNYIKTRIDDPESTLNKLTDGKADKLKLHEILNYMRGDEILWKVGHMRGGHGHPGPLWADYLELLEDRYEGINQIFGHTGTGSRMVDNFDGDLVAKVDGHHNYQLTHLEVNI